MKFKFLINKWANFYYFLHNLSECQWPWPARPWNNETWQKEIGNYSKEEQNTLKKFNKVYKNHFLKIYLGKPFFIERNPWQALGKEIPSKEVNELREVFSVWQSNFEKIYKRDLPNLQSWKRKLALEQKKFSKSARLNSMSKILSNLFGCPLPKGDLKIFLMLTGKTTSQEYASGAGGERGRGLDGKSILLELSRCPLEKIDYVLGIIWHEIIHLHYFSLLRPLLLKNLKNKKSARFMEEIIIRSLFPIGIMSIKFFKTPLPITLTPARLDIVPHINLEQTVKILNLSIRYISQKQKIDSQYIRELEKILRWR